MNKYKNIFEILEKEHQPTMLEQFSGYNHFQLLIATLLSARTKDTTTIPIARKLFKRCSAPEDFLQMKAKELEKELYGIGFYRVKARNIKLLCSKLIAEFKDKVPSEFEELVTLPGVGRKTANCLLNYAFGKEAIAVDVHVHRISNRLGWVKTNKEEETEIELRKVLPKESWSKVNMLLVGHGQRICLPVKPKCNLCKIKERCGFYYQSEQY